MRTEITAGQTSDYLGFDLVMADNLPEPSVLLADRGYDSDNIRKTMEVRDVVPVIPMRKTRKLRVAVDRRLYRLRNLVERCFNKLKNARRVATRLTTRPPKASWASSTSRRSASGSAICQHDLTEPSDLVEADESAAEDHEGLMDVGAPLIPDGEAAKAVQPCQCPLDDPTVPAQAFAAVHAAPGNARLDRTFPAFAPAAAMVLFSLS